MARGTVVGERIVSQANTAEFNEGYDRTFGPDRKPVRGRWVYDERLGKCVPADEYQRESRAIDAPIMVDRFMEGHAALDGTDLGSRRKRDAYMKAHGLLDANDFSMKYYENKRAEQAREAAQERRQDVVDIYKRHRATPTVENVSRRQWTEGIDG